MSLKSIFKGWLGEKFTALAMGLTLDSKIYHRVGDLIIEDNLGTTQIDHILVSRYGIFVIEVKDMKGWIYGKPSDKQWTQSFKTAKYRFQNPMNQNYRHIKVLSGWLQLPEDKFHSLVYFGPDCELKSSFPENVRNRGGKPFIESFKDEILMESEVAAVLDKIKQHKKTQSSKKEHIQSLKERHESTTVCPKCGEPLVERDGRNGKFIGCTGFPKCRYTKSY